MSPTNPVAMRATVAGSGVVVLATSSVRLLSRWLPYDEALAIGTHCVLPEAHPVVLSSRA